MREEVRKRLGWIKVYERTGDAGLTCRRCGISRPTLRKWLRRYEARGEEGLMSQSRCPKHFSNRKITEEIEGWIIGFREERNLGARRIQNELNWLYKCSLSLSSIHKVLKRNEVAPLKKSPRKRQGRRYQRAIPGDRVQADTCKIQGGVYLYTAIDDCTRYMVLGVYHRRSAKNTIHFLSERVIEEMPFPIQRLQTDNGNEFKAYLVQDFLKAHSIKFRPIRPRSPHLNGKVERAQQTVLREFFALQDRKLSIEDLNEELACWQHYYNWDRIHGAIGNPSMDKVCALLNRTPLWEEVIENYSPKREHQYHLKKLLEKTPKN